MPVVLELLIFFCLCLWAMSWTSRITIILVPFFTAFLIFVASGYQVKLFENEIVFLYTFIPAYAGLVVFAAILGLMRRFTASYEVYLGRRNAILKFTGKWVIIYVCFTKIIKLIIGLFVSDTGGVWFISRTIAPYLFVFVLVLWSIYKFKRKNRER